MEVRKASFIPVTSMGTPLHHRLGGILGILGDLGFFMGKIDLSRSYSRAPWALVKDRSGVKIPHLNKREAHFSVVTLRTHRMF